MGLQITKTDSRYGIDLDYWKIGEIKANWHTQHCRVFLLGFVNKTQRDDGKDAVTSRVFTFEDAAFTFTHDTGLVAQIYAAIKADVDWSAAIDVLES